MEPSDPTRILVVDDNQVDLELAQRAFGRHGWGPIEVMTASTFSQASELLQQSCFHLILLDLGLRDADGTKALGKLISADPNTPVVVLTGNKDDQLAVQMLEEGAQDYLCKDEIQPDELVRRAHHAIVRFRRWQDAWSS